MTRDVTPSALDEIVVGDDGLNSPLNAPASHGATIGEAMLGGQRRTARAAATWAMSMLFTLVTLSVAFVTTPLLLRYLGQERLGAFRAASEWIGYLSLIDLGLTPALGVLILQARAGGSDAQTAGVVRGGVKLLTAVALVTAAAGLVLAAIMPQLVPVSAGLRHELIVSTVVAAAGVLFLPFQISRMVLDAEQRGYRVSQAHLVQTLIAAALGVVLAWAGWGLVAQSTALLVGAVAGTVLYLLPTWRWYLAPPIDAVPTLTPRSIWRLSWPLALAGLGVRLNLMTDSLVVAYVMGPTAVFHLFVTQRAVSLFGGQINGLVTASWAALAELRMTGRQDAFVSGIVELTGLVVGLGTALTGTVASFNHQFVRLWVGGEHYGGDLLSYLTAAATVVIGLTTIYGFALDTAGQTAARVPVSLAGAIANLALSVTFTRVLGLPGVVLGTLLASLAADTWFNPFLVSRRFGVAGRQILAAVVGGLIRGLPWVLVAAGLAHRYQPSGWAAFAAEVVLVGGASLAYAWFVVLKPSDRQRWKMRLGQRLFRRRRASPSDLTPAETPDVGPRA